VCSIAERYLYDTISLSPEDLIDRRPSKCLDTLIKNPIKASYVVQMEVWPHAGCRTSRSESLDLLDEIDCEVVDKLEKVLRLTAKLERLSFRAANMNRIILNKRLEGILW